MRGSQVPQLSRDNKSLIVLRTLLAYAVREINALDTPPEAAVEAIAMAYQALDDAVLDAVGPTASEAARIDPPDVH